MATTIYKGANKILERPLMQSDGTTPLPVSSILAAQVELMQGGKVKRTLVFGTDEEIRAGDDGESLVLELTSEITAALAAGALTERYKIEIVDTDFEAEPDKAIDKIDVQDVTIKA
jgi:hypothetical protein